MSSALKHAVIHRVGEVYLKKVYRNQVAALRNARVVQERLFVTFQKQLAGTALGRDINLDRYASFSDFIKRFRPQPYAFYDPYVQRILNGENGVMYRDDTEYYFMTSGTSGFNSKVIPCNTGLKNVIFRFQQKVMSVVFPECHGVKLTSDRFAYGSRSRAEFVRGIPKDYISGVLPSLIPNVLKEYVVPSQDVLAEPCWETKIQRIVEQTRHRDVRLVSGLPAYLLQILKDIVEHLKIENLREIWPRLEACVYSGTSVRQYEKSLNQWAGTELKYFGAYVSTECPVGFEMPALSTGKRPMFFAPDLVLYSFCDLNGRESVPLTMDELKVGGEYSVNVGTPNGLLHYGMNDYIKITEVNPFVQFEFQGRLGAAMNVAAEKVSEVETAKAIQLLQQRLPLTIEHYFVYPSEVSSGQPAYEWIFATDTRISRDDLAEHIDQALMSVSADYQEARLHTRVLALPRVELFSSQLVKQYIENRQRTGPFKMKTAFRDKKEFMKFKERVWD